MATPTLPVDPHTGELVPFTAQQIAAMDVRTRGVGNGTHVRYNFGPEGSGCTRKFSCDWDERFNTLFYFVGAVVSYNDPDTGVRKLSRLLPLTDPDFTTWICTKVEFEPFAFTGESEEDTEYGSEGYPVFTRADFSATFELVPWNVEDDDVVASYPTREQTRYVTLPGFPGADVASEANYVGLPGSTLQYATPNGAARPAGVAIPYPVGFAEATKKLKLIWRRIPKDVWGPGTALFNRLIGTETTRGYLGAVNLTTFQGYPPLSLQLVGIEERLLPDATGLGYSWDLAYVFTEKVCPYGQLGFYYHDTTGAASGYYQVLRPAAGRTTIAAASLTDISSLHHVREFADLFFPGVPW